MAWMQCSVYSEILEKTVNLDVIIPEPDIFYSREALLNVKGFQTVYLLHGKGYDCTDWIKNCSIERYAMENQVAIVMPDINDGKYDNEKYWMYLTEECIEMMEFYFPLSSKQEDRFVIGIEQGGIAALRWVSEVGETFTKAIDISAENNNENKKEVKNQWDEWDGELHEIIQSFPLKRNVYRNV